MRKFNLSFPKYTILFYLKQIILKKLKLDKVNHFYLNLIEKTNDNH